MKILIIDSYPDNVLFNYINNEHLHDLQIDS